MQYRRFGETDLVVSEIGFGAWAIGGGAMIGTTSIGWGDADDAVSKEAMQQLKSQGKIRYWGLSLNTFDPEPEAGYLMKQELGHGFQLVLNILNQRALPIIKTAGGEGYGIIVRMPLQFGLLTGKFNSESKFAINDHRHSRLTREVISKSSQALEPVWELCNKYKLTKAQLALSYSLM